MAVQKWWGIGLEIPVNPVIRSKRGTFCFVLLQGDSGVIVVKTHMYLVVSTYIKGMYPGVCVEATEKLGEFVSPNLHLHLPCLSAFAVVD